jgi:hypothetical protein
MVDGSGNFKGVAAKTFPVAKHGAALINRDATGELYGLMATHTL